MILHHLKKKNYKQDQTFWDSDHNFKYDFRYDFKYDVKYDLPHNTADVLGKKKCVLTLVNHIICIKMETYFLEQVGFNFIIKLIM